MKYEFAFESGSSRSINLRVHLPERKCRTNRFAFLHEVRRLVIKSRFVPSRILPHFLVVAAWISSLAALAPLTSESRPTRASRKRNNQDRDGAAIISQLSCRGLGLNTVLRVVRNKILGLPYTALLSPVTVTPSA